MMVINNTLFQKKNLGHDIFLHTILHFLFSHLLSHHYCPTFIPLFLHTTFILILMLTTITISLFQLNKYHDHSIKYTFFRVIDT